MLRLHTQRYPESAAFESPHNDYDRFTADARGWRSPDAGLGVRGLQAALNGRQAVDFEAPHLQKYPKYPGRQWFALVKVDNHRMVSEKNDDQEMRV